jgi:hypothetical protein
MEQQILRDDEKTVRDYALKYCDLVDQIQDLKEQLSHLTKKQRSLTQRILGVMKERKIRRVGISGTKSCITLQERKVPTRTNEDFYRRVYQTANIDTNTIEQIFDLVKKFKLESTGTVPILKPITEKSLQRRTEKSIQKATEKAASAFGQSVPSSPSSTTTKRKRPSSPFLQLPPSSPLR